MIKSKSILIFLLFGCIICGLLSWNNISYKLPFFYSIPIYSSTVKTPIFSKESGIVDAQTITISGKNVYYTLDGSLPTLQSKKYSHPLLLIESQNTTGIENIPTSFRWKPAISVPSECIVIRAVCANESGMLSNVITRVFLTNQKKHNLPILHLTIPEAYLFSNDSGLYVVGNQYYHPEECVGENGYIRYWWELQGNYHKRGKAWEREAYMNFFDTNGKSVQGKIGVRINGNATRAYPLKSLRLYERKKLDSTSLNYPFFTGDTNSDFSRLILRNSGNDWDRSLIRDGMMQTIAPKTVALQLTRQTVVYINGTYWGIHNLRPRIDDNYLGKKYNLSPKEITIVEDNGILKSGNDTINNEYLHFIQKIKNSGDNDIVSYNLIKTNIDIASFIDYLCCEIFFCNTDWPKNNVLFWRAENKDFSKWQYVLNDLDYGFGFTGSQAINFNMFQHIMNANTDVTILFSHLKNNNEFKQMFVSRMNVLLSENFESNNCLRVLNIFASNIESEMTNHIYRWQNINSIDSWKSELQGMRDFANQRQQFIKKQMFSFFNLEDLN